MIVLELWAGGLGLSALLAFPIATSLAHPPTVLIMEPPNHPWEAAYPRVLALSQPTLHPNHKPSGHTRILQKDRYSK